jgi:hypothetical protein
MKITRVEIRKYWPVIACLLAALVLRSAWKLYTHFTFEDAFITFRFARNLANGLGFVYNAHQPIYGTTTPLLTMLLAAWIKVFPNLIVLGSSLLGLLSGLVSIFLVWKLSGELHINTTPAVVVIAVLALSDKLWIHDTGGMETALVVYAMLATYFMLVRSRPIWAGVFAGLLLWIRIDGIFWLGMLVLAACWYTRQIPWKFMVSAGLVYLPWAVFASLYFGSPIPYTISAKWVAYQTPGLPPFLTRFQTLVSWLTPFSLATLSPSVISWAAALTIVFSFIGALAYRRYKWFMLLPVFCLEEMLRLAGTGETFASRYFLPLFWCLMILFGLGLQAVWAALSRRFMLKPGLAYAAMAVYICISLGFSFQRAQLYRDTQYFLNDGSLKQMGIWLEKNTPTSSTVYLEPLGYVGFYADRPMLDQVGLVTPQVVALHRQGYSLFDMITSLDPDYAVLHCDDALQASQVFLGRYSKVVEFNPLGFDPHTPLKYDPNASEQGMANLWAPRAACYQVWKK